MKAVLLSLPLLAGAMELTPANWDAAVAGKQVFIKFLAPWCGHCKSMKPDWDKLIDDFKDSKTSLVADVDCTGEGKELCEKNKVSGYPTIKHGDPEDLKDYQGGRTYNDLKKFADENLGPSCGPENIDLCKDEDKALIEKFQAMTDEELDKAIAEADAKIAKIEEKGTKAVTKLESQVADLQKRVEAETKKKDDNTKKESKKIGLGVMRKVASTRKKQDEDDGASSSKKKRRKRKA